MNSEEIYKERLRPFDYEYLENLMYSYLNTARLIREVMKEKDLEK